MASIGDFTQAEGVFYRWRAALGRSTLATVAGLGQMNQEVATQMDGKLAFKAFLGGTIGLVALFGLVACGGSGGSSSLPGDNLGNPPAVSSGVTINYKVTGADDGDVGPDGKKHDTFKTLDPTSIKVGQSVTLNFSNTDDMPHSFTLPDLGINVTIPGAMNGMMGTASYTFTADKAGNYRWFCAVPCDTDNAGWAMTMTPGTMSMGQNGFMAGFLTVQ